MAAIKLYTHQGQAAKVPMEEGTVQLTTRGIDGAQVVFIGLEGARPPLEVTLSGPQASVTLKVVAESTAQAIPRKIDELVAVGSGNAGDGVEVIEAHGGSLIGQLSTVTIRNVT
ncbi:hypothetical protein [Streptomyces sp. WAC01280]|uniref:hypothetical protein n=1 Tax=Streptomyces sp. WAC01280 TaxID=2487424 RepID=UPI000F7A2595|nr:hypothetical protein [Streptomyces sp. WAC01280]RSS57516.1 hypothetical protein EF909_16425 [Streptomyces sp. WAC01280]